MVNEQLKTLAQLARMIPSKNRKPVNPSTVWRWARQGVRMADGSIIKLEAIPLGSRHWVSSVEALARFSVKIKEARDNEPPHIGRPPLPDWRTTKEREKAVKRAD